MFIFLYIFCIASAVIASPSPVDVPYYIIDQVEQLFEDFILTHGKIYADEKEKQRRLQIFKENLKIINEKNTIGGAAFKINHLADISEEEFKRQYLGFYPSFEKHKCEMKSDVEVKIKAPQSLNWTDKGAVTSVKNQKNCGACWAFGTIGNIESQYFLKTGKLLSFSEQLLVDCSKSNRGCDGGDVAKAMTDIMDLGGVELESDYPYLNYEEQCNFDKTKVVINLAGCTVYNLDDEADLKELLAQKGPLVIGLNGKDVNVYYHHGVLTKEHCSDTIDNDGFHAVLLVGYGTDEKGQDYWLIKNSWGSDFGENGYFRISRGENTCGIMHFINSKDRTTGEMHVYSGELSM